MPEETEVVDLSHIISHLYCDLNDLKEFVIEEQMAAGPNIKRLVDLVDRGPEDDVFYPAASNNSIFHREFDPYHNVVPDIVEIGYKGSAAWGSRITIPLNRKDVGDLLQWLCVRIKPASWLGSQLEAKLLSGLWDFNDKTGATWTWAASLGSVAIAKVELEIGDTLIETWPGEWMDVWSRTWMDAGRSGGWDADIYGQRPYTQIWKQDSENNPASVFRPSEDGYIYCWLPLAFFKRPSLAIPLLAVDRQEIHVHVTFRPFTEVIRRQRIPRTDPCETPLGSSIVLQNQSGGTPIPWGFTLPTTEPGFDDISILAGVVHTEDPLRSAYLRNPMEMLYEPVTYMKFAIPEPLIGASQIPITLNFPLTELNGPVREICFFLRRRSVWQFNEWTNYGSLSEQDFSPVFAVVPGLTAQQRPILQHAKLYVGNAVWRDESEQWWRTEYALDHRGGVRNFKGFVYGFSFGDAPKWTPDDLQPAGTVNASRADLRLTLTMLAPTPSPNVTYVPGWDLHVFGITYDWMRFVGGHAGPLFRD